MNWQFLSSLRQGFAKWFVLAVSIVILLFVFLAVLRIGFAFTIYSAVANWVTVRLGFDYYVAEFTAVVLTALIMMFLPSILWFFISGRSKEKATIATIVGMGIICLLVYTLGQDVYFNRQTGDPLRYYADTPNGRIFSFTKGFDPEYGNEFQPYTREIANEKKDGKKQKELTAPPNPQNPKEVSKINFSPDISTNLTFTNSEYGSCSMKVQPIEITSFDNNSINLKFSVCNSGSNNFDVYKIYFWYTPPNGASINWEDHFNELKPNECDIKTISSTRKQDLLRPFGVLNISLNQREVFGKINLDEADKQGKIQ